MTVNLSALAGAGQQFFDNNGVILTGGKLYSYVAGTSTPQTTYTSSSGITAHTNPIVLDSAGRVATGEIWLTAGSNYKFALYTSVNVLIATWDNITGINGTGITTNASSVQYDPAGVGAVSTTVKKALDTLTQYPSGQWYAENGANIDRLVDRVFIGDATKNLGTNVASQPDWLTTYQISKGRSYGYVQSAQSAIETQNSPDASNCLVLGAQTKTLYDNYNSIGLISIAASNKITGTGKAYAGYFEGYRDVGADGGAYGVEIDTINYQSSIGIDPYQQLNGQTIALQIAAGGEYASTGQFESTAAINIRNNGSTFQRGLMFGADSLTGCNGIVGTALAIVLAKGHGIVWYGSQNNTTSAIYCTGTTPGLATTMNFAEGSVTLGNSTSSKNTFVVNNIGITSVNYLGVTPSATGNPVQFNALGDDTNVDIQFVPKGSGAVWLGVHTAGVLSATGYITVKDSTGTTRRLLVG